MKYMLLIHHNPNFMDNPPEPMDQIMGEVGRLIGIGIARNVGAVGRSGILKALLVDVQVAQSGIQ